MTPDVRVEAIVSGRLAASTRFRVLQHVAPLRRLGIEVSARPPRISKYASVPTGWAGYRLVRPAAALALDGAKLGARVPGAARSWRADVTWLEREVLPGHVTLEPFLHRPVLFDVDDAIWLLSPGHERATRAVARRAACVVAGNDYLADWFGSIAPAVERVWTAVDTQRFAPRPRAMTGPSWWGGRVRARHFGTCAPSLPPWRAFWSRPTTPDWSSWPTPSSSSPPPT